MSRFDRSNGDGAVPDRTLEIDGVQIHDGSDCYVIAEIGHNHQGSLEHAKELFAEAARCGANAVKLQKRDNRALYTEDYFNRPYDNPNSFGPTYGQHREALEFGREEYLELKAYADELGLTFFSTAFDRPSVDFLEDVGIAAYKVASADLNNTPLLRYIADTGKPMIVSTGASTFEDVERAYDTLAGRCSGFAILQCTAGYPAEWEELDLRVIETYRECFPDAVIGFSSHDNGISMPVIAFVLGARIVEKHFTLNRANKGTDHAFSLEPQGLEKMVRDLGRARLGLGRRDKSMYPSEAEPAVKMGKKLVAASDLPAGHVLTEDDLASKSPGDGLAPYHLDQLVGRVLRYAIPRDSAITFDVIEAVEDERAPVLAERGRG